jgi:hypothetical protein
MVVSAASLKGGPKRSHLQGTSNSVRAMQFLTLNSVSRLGHGVFRSMAPKAVWPTGEDLLHFSTKTLNEKWGIVKLQHFTYNGDPGIAFITSGEAEALRRHFGLATLKRLSQAQIVGRREQITDWTIRDGRAASARSDSPVNQRKSWIIQAKDHLLGSGEAPSALIVWLGKSGDLCLFAMKIPLYTIKNTRVRVELIRGGNLGLLLVTRPSGQPLIDSHGKKLEMIILAENGVLVDPQVFWSTKP